VLIVAGPDLEQSAERVEQELHLVGYSALRASETASSLERLRAREVQAVVVITGRGHTRYYVLRAGEVLVETQLDDAEHPESLPVKTAEGVRSTLMAEQVRAQAPAAPRFELALGPLLDATSYSNPRLGFEATGLFRLQERFYLGPRARATLVSDYGEVKSELGAANAVLGVLGCAPLRVGEAFSFGFCASVGARAIFLSILTGPKTGQDAGAIWGPLVGGALSASYAVSEHFALKSALHVDVGLGVHSGASGLPKRSTDLLAAQAQSSYFGLDVGLGLYAVYLLR
jgi:hypothetical protein